MSISGEEMKIITCHDISDEDCVNSDWCESCPAYRWNIGEA